MKNVKDRWFRLISVVFPLLLAIFFKGWLAEPVGSATATQIFLLLLLIVCVSEGSRLIIIAGCRLFTGRHRTVKRMLATIPAGILYISLLLVLNDIIFHYLEFGEWKLADASDSHLYINNKKVTIGVFGSSVFKATLLFFLFLFVYEVIRHYAHLRHIQKEKEQLEKDKLKAELIQLKEILHPHFLFNSLNSLSFLISEDPVQAEKFLDELTKVYRYLLRNNDTELTTLKNEIRFIHSYFHLLQTRYGEGLQLHIHIDQGLEMHLMPPLTLQLLVENAVKHNQLHKEHPLCIQLFTNRQGQLVISNNVQKKSTRVDSTGIGLQNITAKYKLLNRQGIEVEQTEKTFLVKVPLIENYAYKMPEQQDQEAGN